MPDNHACYLGIDGGGTHVRAVVVDWRGREIGRGRAGSANPSSVGLEIAVANIKEAVNSAARRAGVNLPVAAAWCGLAGVDRPADHAALAPLLVDLAVDLRLINDAELALLALPGMRGVCLVAGTGSIAVGRDSTGRKARAGGWGHVMGDEGSGYDLGRRALQAVAQAADGRRSGTALLDALLKAWGLGAPEELMGQVYPQANTHLVAGVAPIVFQVAAEGDETARQIVEEAAEELAAAVLAVAHKLELKQPVPLAFTGGLLLGQHMLQARLVDLLRDHIEIEPIVLVDDAALVAAQSLVPSVSPGDIS